MAKVDPRLRKVTGGTVNTKLQARAIKHSTYLEQYKNGEVQRIVAMINDDVLPDLLSEYNRRLANIASRGYDTSVATTTRLRQLIKATDGMLRGSLDQVEQQLKDDLSELALSEADWQLAALTDIVPVKIDFLTPNPDLLRSIVDERPFDGHLMSDWFSRLADDTQHRLTQQIQIGLTAGESIPDISNRLTDTVGLTRRNAEAITRTATTHVTAQARETTYDTNSDVIDGVMMVATLDDRTTEICMAQDGKVYPVNEGPRPPFHYNCRTTTVPVLKSWKSLGINLKEAPPSTRASMDGQVPETLKYGDWLAGQTKEVQDEALGPARAELFRTGEVSIDKFVNDKGKLLTLDELKARQ